MLVRQKKQPPDPFQCLIRLSGGRYAIVDPELHDWLSGFYWRAVKSSSGTYARTRTTTGGKTITVRMHRLILNAPSHMKVHHINHNSLDNRRSNLMLVTEREHRHFDGWHIFNT